VGSFCKIRRKCEQGPFKIWEAFKDSPSLDLEDSARIFGPFKIWEAFKDNPSLHLEDSARIFSPLWNHSLVQSWRNSLSSRHTNFSPWPDECPGVAYSAYSQFQEPFGGRRVYNDKGIPYILDGYKLIIILIFQVVIHFRRCRRRLSLVSSSLL
jgi:hypothetical protein